MHLTTKREENNYICLKSWYLICTLKNMLLILLMEGAYSLLVISVDSLVLVDATII